jgi:hypothetical protein
MGVRHVMNAPKVPNYPGKRQAEALVAPAARAYSARVVMRLLGYWVVRQHLKRAEIVERGWMGERQSWAAAADFKAVFKKSVDQFTWDDVGAALGVVVVQADGDEEAPAE